MKLHTALVNLADAQAAAAAAFARLRTFMSDDQRALVDAILTNSQALLKALRGAKVAASKEDAAIDVVRVQARALEQLITIANGIKSPLDSKTEA